MTLQKPPILPTFMTLIGIGVLCALGTWQLQRLGWKQTVLDKLDAAYNGTQTTSLIEQDFTPGNFIYGHVHGVVHTDKALLLGPRTRDGEIGADLIVPITTPKGTLFVDMGWTDSTLEKLPIHHVKGKTVRFEGLARAPGWNGFTPENVPEQDLWYKADLGEMATAKSLPAPLPYMLYAEQASYKFDAAFPNNRRWHPDNNHLQYAVFWFTMAGILAAIFILRFVVVKRA